MKTPEGQALSTPGVGTGANGAPDPVADLRRILVRMAWRDTPTIHLRYADDLDTLTATVLELPPVRDRFAHDHLTVRLDGADDPAMPVELQLENFDTAGKRSPAAVLARKLLGPTAWRRAIGLTADGQREATVMLGGPERDKLVEGWKRYCRPVRVVGVQVLPGVLHGVLVNDQGETIDVAVLAMEGTSPEVVASGVDELTRMLWASERDRDCVRAVGVQIGGPVGPQDGVVHHYLKGRLAEDRPWRDVNLGKLVKDRLDSPVVVLNDVSSLALFERWHGLGQRFHRYGLILVSEGIGGALVTGGALDADSPMEIGNIVIHRPGRKCRCGSTGCVEAHASVRAIVDRVNEETGYDVVDLAGAAALADEDEIVRQVFHSAGEDLAVGIGSVQGLLELKAWAIYLPAELNDGGVAAREFWWGIEQYETWVSFERSRQCDLRRRTSNVEAPRGAAFAALERFGCSAARAGHHLAERRPHVGACLTDATLPVD